VVVFKKQVIEEDVYTKAVERVNQLYDRFDKVVVSFSGGKDSTACLNVCLDVARERGKLPLDVYFWDEEAIHPTTIDYVRRVADSPEIRFKWLCIPVKHRNACSRIEPWWYPWEEAKRDVWVRDVPEDAITHLDFFKKGDTVPDIAHKVYGREHGMIADVRGLRAGESLNRYRAVANKLVDNWIGGPRDGYSCPVSPIYDWTTADVWLAPKMFGWDYNITYDIFEMSGISLDDQRVCPPYGEEPLRGLYQYAICFPEMWDKMIDRVKGAATAARYSQTELYGYGKLQPPEGLSWQAWLFNQVELYPPQLQKQISQAVMKAIRLHRGKTLRPIPDVRPDPETGISWRYLVQLCIRGDMKGRKLTGMSGQGAMEAARLGFTPQEITAMNDEEVLELVSNNQQDNTRINQ